MPPESMVIEAQRAIAELRKKMESDPEFATHMRWMGDFFRRWYATAGYKLICQFIKGL